MTGFLTVERLQALSITLNDHGTTCQSGHRRPALTARWKIASDGRLTCHWLAEDPAPDCPVD